MAARKAINSHESYNFVGRLTKEREASVKAIGIIPIAIDEYLADNDNQPKPFVWTASAQQIINRINRCKGSSETLH